ncbi:MAG: CDP-alcohol phosphatidyltransferase family protein [Muribaculaceae bacterium]|nr:CDP-alcohol phosphatidyltransferase family protein [Muribaculaceae bacterium]
METKKSAFNVFRDALQQGIYKVINPFVRLLIKIGFTPNMVSTVGLFGNLCAAALFAVAGFKAMDDGGMHWTTIWVAGIVIIASSLFDMLDGQVARLGNMVSRFGAFYDSVLDRYCEMITLGGIAFYLICINAPAWALVTFLALVGSVMVSYTRARAEGLDVECKVGFMQRPERVVVTSLCAIAAGITGESGADEAAVLIIGLAMALIAALANLTAFVRIAHTKAAIEDK